MELTLLPIPNDVQQVQDLSKDAKILGFSNLTNTRLLVLNPTRGGQATKIQLDSLVLSRAQPPALPVPNNKKPVEVLLSSATLDGEEVLVEYKRYARDNTQMDLKVTEESIIFLSKILSVEGDTGEDAQDSKTPNLRRRGCFYEPQESRFGLVFDIPQGYD